MSELIPSSQIEWRADFETGYPAIDHEHKDMIGRINGFLDAAGTEPETPRVIEHLGEIYAWISAHFALEEKIMRDHQYDQYASHKEDHEKLLDDLRDIMDQIEADGYVGAENIIPHRLSDWFIDHFKTHDAELGKKI